MLLVLEEKMAGEDYRSSSCRLDHIQSHEEVKVSVVIPEFLMELIKAKPHAILGSPSDQSIKTRTSAFCVTNLAIVWLNVLNVIVLLVIHLKNSISFTIPN